jgi:hypothetical protein
MRALFVALIFAGCAATKPVEKKTVNLTFPDLEKLRSGDYYIDYSDPILTAPPSWQKRMSCYSTPDSLGGFIVDCY